MEYFSIYRVPNVIWVLVASMNLEHAAAQWWIEMAMCKNPLGITCPNP
jgi:hypothetical protein